MSKLLTFIKILSVLIWVTGISGCASIVSGSDEKVRIESEPAGASVLIDEVERGTTPLEIELPRGKLHRICFKKAGYGEETIVTTNSMNGWIFGNILIGGLIGMSIDMSSGAANDIDPNPVHVILTPLSTPSSADKEQNKLLQREAQTESVPRPKWMPLKEEELKPIQPQNPVNQR